jgi:predicted nucleotidyltransferase
MFALAAIKELSKVNIDSLSFGCENDDIKLLKRIASIQMTPEYNIKIKEEMKKGLSYPKAMSNSLKSVLKEDSIAVYSPNNVLAVEYIKSALKLNLSLDCYPVKRLGMGHNETEVTGSFHSATAIRNSLIKNSFKDLKLTEKSFELIERFYRDHYKFNSLNNYVDYLYYKILTCDDLTSIYEIKEGLDNKIMTQVYRHENIDDLIMSLKSKRYTYSKLRRCLLNILLDIKKVNINKFMLTNNDYIKVLAFNNIGRQVIKDVRAGGIKVINRYSDYKKYDLDPKKLDRFQITNMSSNIYYLPLKNRKINSEYTENAVYVDV